MDWKASSILYDLDSDPKLKNNIAKEHPDICEKTRQLAVTDAGGKIPDSLRKATGAPGCSPLLAE